MNAVQLHKFNGTLAMVISELNMHSGEFGKPRVALTQYRAEQLSRYLREAYGWTSEQAKTVHCNYQSEN